MLTGCAEFKVTCMISELESLSQEQIEEPLIRRSEFLRLEILRERSLAGTYFSQRRKPGALSPISCNRWFAGWMICIKYRTKNCQKMREKIIACRRAKLR